MRFYLDTSIFGGLFDQEFKKPTRALFDFIKTKRIKIIYSDILEKELELAPKSVKLLATNKLVQAECIDITEEMLDLAKMHIKEGALTQKSINDARHIAIATIAGASAIITWNFKHMANFIKIQQYNAINLREGYRMIRVCHQL
jgi:predicted nucleic acid-binding protein